MLVDLEDSAAGVSCSPEGTAEGVPPLSVAVPPRRGGPRPPAPPKPCITCGAEFSPYRPAQLYCGAACARAFRYARDFTGGVLPTPRAPGGFCGHCGCAFRASTRHGPPKQFCSKRCKEAHRHAKRTLQSRVANGTVDWIKAAAERADLVPAADIVPDAFEATSETRIVVIHGHQVTLVAWVDRAEKVWIMAGRLPRPEKPWGGGCQTTRPQRLRDTIARRHKQKRRRRQQL